ncbi:RdgB/HAM1 family non-canonical purine NTP pyrophosphatase [Spiroplasma apis]|uniref:dITP/XTP pyrophosphatase n=1 Tax=Spiroplasma apis B31 TaxID=1276258 RepID=V5RIF7_SPIAP|nr:RdgB/HAM1 family non-canonical purine NTP pyrophosphatase [Spiroplasma apis]AHB36253.1 dITP/XTP pyrophosphatase [Spiroplasma apis B31]
MKKIWIATNNEGKIKDFKTILTDYEIKTLKDLDKNIDIPENENTFEGNSLAKAKYLAKIVNEKVIADDSGICIDNLDNFPGVYSARWAKPLTDWSKINDKLLSKLEEANLLAPNDRKAHFISCITFLDEKNNIHKTFVGRVDGIISFEQKGENGFAYDKIFIPNGYTKTFAEMTFEEKNSISHRRQAIELMKNFFKEYNKEN